MDDSRYRRSLGSRAGPKAYAGRASTASVESMLLMGGTEAVRSPLRLLPMAAAVGTIVFLATTYVTQHCLRLLQEDERRGTATSGAAWQLAVFSALAAVVVYCFVRASLMDPGSIPDGAEWERGAAPAESPDEARRGSLGSNSSRGQPTEFKRSGQQRHCKWCLRFKPDRCHHCRVCGKCALRMDHHCPWIHNCVGIRNYKLFFLLVIYSQVSLVFICVTMFETVWWSTRVDVSVATMVWLIGAETFATFLAVLVGIFLLFHVWLQSKAMTTVEFCEKRLKDAAYDGSRYSNSSGAYANFCAVLGPSPLLWLLPVALWQGDGVAPPPGSPAAARFAAGD